MAILPASSVIPTSLGNKYPQTVYSDQGKRGSVTGKVLPSGNSQDGIDDCYIAIVNASNVNEEYAHAITVSNGNFQFTEINVTYSSTIQFGPDGTPGSYEKGISMYKLYANKSPYGEGYSEPFGIDVNETNNPSYNVVIQPRWTSISLTADNHIRSVNGIEAVRLTASVSDSSGVPAPDGAMVDFTVDVPGWTYRNGSINGENSQSASVPVKGGKAVAYYGWFPGNGVEGTRACNNTPIKAALHYFDGISASAVARFAISTPTPTPLPTTSSPTPEPTVTVSPDESNNVTVTPVVVTPEPTVTPPVPEPTESPTPEPQPNNPYIGLIIGMIMGISIGGLIVYWILRRIWRP